MKAGVCASSYLLFMGLGFIPASSIRSLKKKVTVSALTLYLFKLRSWKMQWYPWDHAADLGHIWKWMGWHTGSAPFPSAWE